MSVKWVVTILLPYFLLVNAAKCQSQTRKLSSFTKILVVGNFHVRLNKGESESVTINISKRKIAFNDIATEIVAGELQVSFASITSMVPKNAVSVEITYKNLEGIKLNSFAFLESDEDISGVGNFDITVSNESQLNASINNYDELTIEATNAGIVDVTVNVSSIATSLSGAASVTLQGKVDAQKIDADSSSKYEASSLVSSSATVIANSESEVTVLVNKKLEARASKGAKIDFEGTPPLYYANSKTGGWIKKLKLDE